MNSDPDHQQPHETVADAALSPSEPAPGKAAAAHAEGPSAPVEADDDVAAGAVPEADDPTPASTPDDGPDDGPHDGPDDTRVAGTHATPDPTDASSAGPVLEASVPAARLEQEPARGGPVGDPSAAPTGTIPAERVDQAGPEADVDPFDELRKSDAPEASGTSTPKFVPFKSSATDASIPVPPERLDELREPGALVIACASDEVLDIAVTKIEQTYSEPTVVWDGAATAEDDERTGESGQRVGLHALLETLAASKHTHAVIHVRDRELLESVGMFCSRDVEGTHVRLVFAVHTGEVRLGELVPEHQLWCPNDVDALLELAHRRWLKRPRRPGEKSTETPSTASQWIERLYGSEVRHDRDHKVRMWLTSGYGYLVEQLRLAQAEGGVLAIQSEKPEWARSSICCVMHFLMNSMGPLTPNMFGSLMDVLLGDMQERGEEEERTETEEGVVVRTVRTSEEALPLWNGREDYYLDKCGVEESYISPKTYVYHNDEQGVRVAVHLRWRHSRFRRDRFERLFSAGLFFAPQTSPRLVSRLIELAAEMARDYPEDYGESWLTDMLMQIERDREHSATFAIALAESINAYVEGLVRAHVNTSFFYRRLADLCAAFMRSDDTSPAVRGLLQSLRGANAAGADVLWRLSKHLRGRDGFSYLDQAEHILHNAEPHWKVEVLRGLVRDVLEDELRRERVLARLITWLPAVDADRANPREDYAIGFLWELTQIGCQTPRMEEVFVRTLFAGSGDSAFELETWVLHPRLVEGVRAFLRDREALKREGRVPAWVTRLTGASVLADLMEVWFESIERTGIEGAESGLRRLASKVAGQLTAHERRQMDAAWAHRARRALDQIRRLDVRDKDRIAALRARRSRAIELRSMLSAEGETSGVRT
ncbi:MAG: hypothetical protein GY711_20725 [bacterium]|nr:hypothetical protein [bacterium]